MGKNEKLKAARNILLKLHKTLVDSERASYEHLNGAVNSSQFLSLLLEDEDFEWLRKFSTLIVEIDEMFDLKDAISDEMVEANLQKVAELIEMKEDDEYFRAKYQFALQRDPNAAGLHAQIKTLLA